MLSVPALAMDDMSAVLSRDWVRRVGAGGEEVDRVDSTPAKVEENEAGSLEPCARSFKVSTSALVAMLRIFKAVSCAAPSADLGLVKASSLTPAEATLL